MALLQQLGHASRAEIARRSGLSRTTVSSLVSELLSEGLVVERIDWGRRVPSAEGGRPATLLTLDPSSGAFLGIDFGHTSVRVVLVDRSGEMLGDDVEERDVDHDASEALNTAGRLAEALLERADLSPQRVLGAGVAVSAPLRSGASPVFASSRIFSEWAGVDIDERIAVRFGCPVHIGNDANLGALAECTFGVARGAENVLYVMLSAGVGLGLWLRGELFTGQTGTAGELGHVVVDPEGRICRCGNRGCLETVAGAEALIGALGYARGSDVHLAEFLDLARQGDRGAVRLLADAGRAVGRALAGVCSILDPALVVIGGELAAVGDILATGIRELIERDTSPTAGRSYEVVSGDLGPLASALGAAALAMDSESRQMLAPGGPVAPA
jgi:predicted NBD/HSP70 family sugar kinase/biotin operon repressor